MWETRRNGNALSRNRFRAVGNDAAKIGAIVKRDRIRFESWTIHLVDHFVSVNNMVRRTTRLSEATNARQLRITFTPN